MTKLHPALKFGQLKNFPRVKGFHASETPDFTPNSSKPLHVGSLQQAKFLAEAMMNCNLCPKYYMFELDIDLRNLNPMLFDEDPGMYYHGEPVVAYINRIEYPKGLQQGDNLSLMVLDAETNVIARRFLEPVQLHGSARRKSQRIC